MVNVALCLKKIIIYHPGLNFLKRYFVGGKRINER